MCMCVCMRWRLVFRITAIILVCMMAKVNEPYRKTNMHLKLQVFDRTYVEISMFTFIWFDMLNFLTSESYQTNRLHHWIEMRENLLWLQCERFKLIYPDWRLIEKNLKFNTIIYLWWLNHLSKHAYIFDEFSFLLDRLHSQLLIIIYIFFNCGL